MGNTREVIATPTTPTQRQVSGFKSTENIKCFFNKRPPIHVWLFNYSEVLLRLIIISAVIDPHTESAPYHGLRCRIQMKRILTPSLYSGGILDLLNDCNKPIWSDWMLQGYNYARNIKTIKNIQLTELCSRHQATTFNFSTEKCWFKSLYYWWYWFT